jgi:4-diphosphocytidyl-2-C-methyl-D-erythritol kinase
MHVYRSDTRVAVQAPAKLNLFFEVLGKRNDGFHEIETLMVPINLYDSLTFSPDPSGRISLHCRWARTADAAALGELPASAENLATKAAVLLRERAGISTGARMRLVKRIPSAAGLGGGSSDAAAALLAANSGWKVNWSTERLMVLAAELGSDVPFFLAGGAAICRGRGEVVEPVGRLGTLFGVVVRPPVGLNTAEVYRHCRPGRPACSVQPLVRAMRRGDFGRLKSLMHNRLEEAAEGLCPWVGRLQHEFARLNCVAAQMSGSGTSYFAICHHAQHARRVAGRLRSRGVGRVYAVRL